jgi:hypothetical protein
MTRKLLKRAMLGLMILQIATPQTLVWQFRRQDLWVRTLIVPKGEFSVDSVERLLRRLLSENAGEDGFIDVRVYPSLEASAANCKCQSDMNYEVWKGQFDDLRSQSLAGAELISYGSDSVMLYRGPAGGAERKVLSGTDPRIIGSPSCSAEIIYVHPSPPSDTPRAGRTEATFFLRSAKEPTEQCARELGGELSRRTHLRALALYVRSDAWFIESEDFPIVYTYEKTLEPPSEADYRASKEAGCFLNDAKLSCWAK